MQGRIEKLFRRISLKDLIAPFIFLMLLIPSWIFKLINKLKRRHLWLVAESGEARDNGFHFYKYVREQHPNDFCFYAVSKKSAGKKKVEELGNAINFGSLKHWLYYMSADLNISSQKAGNPNVLFWYLMHVVLGLYRNRVFLQHGVTMNHVTSLKYERSKFKYFVTTSKREHDEIINYFGYPKDAVLLAGFSRWDDLVRKDGKRKTVLVMPTWRNYLGTQDNHLFDHIDFTKTEYFRAWNEVLNDKEIIDFLEKNNIDLYFYPHQHVQKKLSLFNTSSKRVKIVSMNEEIADYLSECTLMITDYSSVMFDFAYLKKPVIYYQFDQEEFRSKHIEEGYFSYEKDGFGPIVKDIKGLRDKIKKYLIDGMEPKYVKRIDAFFQPKLGNGCSERIYDAISKVTK